METAENARVVYVSEKDRTSWGPYAAYTEVQTPRGVFGIQPGFVLRFDEEGIAVQELAVDDGPEDVYELSEFSDNEDSVPESSSTEEE